MNSVAHDQDVLLSPAASGLVIRGGIVRLTGYVAATALGFLATPFLTRYLGVDDFGRYVAVGTVIAATALIADAGLAVVGTREYVMRVGVARDLLIANLIAIRALISILGVVGATVFAVAAGYSSPMVIGTALAGAALVVTMVQLVYTIPLQVELRLGTVAALDFLRSALTVAGIIVVIVLGGGLVALFAIPIPVALCGYVATLAIMRGRFPMRPSIDGREWSHLVREALPIAIAASLGTLFYRSAIIVMSIVASPTETGYFSASFRVVEAVLIAAGLMAATTFPAVVRAAHDDPARLVQGMQRLFDVAVIIGAWCAVSIIIGAEAIMRFIGGPEFLPAASVLRIQGVALVLSFLVAFWASGLWALRRQRALAWANLVSLGLAVLLTLLLVPSHGARGAAVAMVAVECVLAVVYAVALVRGQSELRPSLHAVPKVVAAAAAASSSWFLPVPDLVKLVVASIAFYVVLAAVRGVPQDFYDAISGRNRT